MVEPGVPCRTAGVSDEMIIMDDNLEWRLGNLPINGSIEEICSVVLVYHEVQVFAWQKARCIRSQSELVGGSSQRAFNKPPLCC